MYAHKKNLRRWGGQNQSLDVSHVTAPSRYESPLATNRRGVPRESMAEAMAEAMVAVTATAATAAVMVK